MINALKINKLTKELNNLTKASLVIKQPWEASQMKALKNIKIKKILFKILIHNKVLNRMIKKKMRNKKYKK